MASSKDGKGIIVSVKPSFKNEGKINTLSEMNIKEYICVCM